MHNKEESQVVQIEHDHEHGRLHAVHEILRELKPCASPEGEGGKEHKSPEGNVA